MWDVDTGEPVFPFSGMPGHTWPAAFSQNLIICFLCVPSCTDGEDEVTPCTPETNRKCVSKHTWASQNNLGLVIGLSVTLTILLLGGLIVWKTKAWWQGLLFMIRASGEPWLREGPLDTESHFP